MTVRPYPDLIMFNCPASHLDSGSRYGRLVFLFDNRRHTTHSLFERMTTQDNDLTRNFMLEINLDVLLESRQRNTHGRQTAN